MISVRLNGRFGNQLFQYAFAYASSRKLGTSFILDRKKGDNELLVYLDIKESFFLRFIGQLIKIKGWKGLFCFRFRILFYNCVCSFLYKGKYFFLDYYQNPSLLLPNLQNNICYEGYFQSEKYFDKYAYEIRNKLQIKTHFQKKFAITMKSSGIEKDNYICIHIRQTDYKDHQWNLPISYYKNAIENIQNWNQYKIVLISDDFNFIKNELEFISPHYISKDEFIVDFQWMMNAKFCVIANSSFSWWAAYLNTKSSKIICPKYYFGFKEKTELPPNIYPENWVQIDFN
jgi:hypothetical protein